MTASISVLVQAIQLVCICLVVFCGAFLLFEVEPLTGKIITPLLGGTTQVWIVCLLFFQLVVLAGYFLTYLVARFSRKVQVVLYVLLFAVSLLWADVPRANAWALDARSDPSWALLFALTAHLGIPLIILSSISGTMQVWYGMTFKEGAYKLYSLSNLGSFAALLLYPTVIEPRLSVAETIIWWHIVYCSLFPVILVGAGLTLKRAAEVCTSGTTPEVESSQLVKGKQIGNWVYLSALGSAALMAFSSYITTDVSPVPLLWVIPLAIYLLTYVIAFAHPDMKTDLMIMSWIPLVVFEVFCAFLLPAVTLVINLLMLFILCLVTNLKLVNARPQICHLPAFYLFLAIGGALGGVLVALVAPMCFQFVAERTIIVLIFTISLLLSGLKELPERRRRLRVAIALLMACVFWFLLVVPQPGTLYCARNFFGSASVKRKGDKLILYHGRIVHGQQYVDPQKARINAYPYFQPAALVFAFLHHLHAGQPLNICIVGLGTGAMAVETSPGDQLRYFEIDPKIYNIAQHWFTYLQNASGDVSVLIGDGRLLMKESGESFDLILIDAFGGDAIPVHLLTTEAINIYLEHLKADGLILFHVTNSYVDLPSVLGNAAAFLNLYGREFDCRGIKYVALSRDKAVLETLDQFSKTAGARFNNTIIGPLPMRRQVGVWTDDFSNLFSVLKWRGVEPH